MARKAKTLKMKAAPKLIKPGRRALITQGIGKGKKSGGYKKK